MIRNHIKTNMEKFHLSNVIHDQTILNYFDLIYMNLN